MYSFVFDKVFSKEGFENKNMLYFHELKYNFYFSVLRLYVVNTKCTVVSFFIFRFVALIFAVENYVRKPDDTRRITCTSIS